MTIDQPDPAYADPAYVIGVIDIYARNLGIARDDAEARKQIVIALDRHEADRQAVSS